MVEEEGVWKIVFIMLQLLEKPEVLWLPQAHFQKKPRHGRCAQKMPNPLMNMYPHT